MKKLLILLLLIASSSLYALRITIAPGTCTGPSALCDEFESQLDKEINGDLPDIPITNYADGIANAMGTVHAGQTSDYSDIFTLFMIKPSVGASIKGTNDNLDKLEEAEGLAVGGSITLGLNMNILPVKSLGPIDFSKLDIFLSFMDYTVDESFGEINFKGEVSNFSLIARYRLVDEYDIASGNMLKWGGLMIHSGLQTGSMNLKLAQNFDGETIDAEVGGQTISGSLDGLNANVTLEANSTIIPIEVSTSLRMLYAFTIYAGVGMDYIIRSDADVELNGSGSVNASGGGATYSTTISANEAASGEGDTTSFRAFAGVQFNLPYFRVYSHVNKTFSNDILALNAGIKILY